MKETKRSKSVATLALRTGLFLLVAACGGGGGGTAGSSDSQSPSGGCGEFGDWAMSAYVLPYTVGEAYEVNQANCSGFGHSGFWQFGYDFTMPIGTLVQAARDGVVVHAQDGAQDGDRSRTNLITIEHSDGTVALYSHLTRGGVHVTIGQPVMAGDPIGQSGDTGNTGGLPHLHWSLHPCASLPGLPGDDSCPSIPANFRNTAPNPEGLVARQTYEALPFDAID